MTTGIPNVHLDLQLGPCRLRILNVNCFLEVGAADRHIMHLIKAILAESQRYGRLAHG